MARSGAVAFLASLALVALFALAPGLAFAAPTQVVTSIPFDGAEGTEGGRFGGGLGIEGLAVNQAGGAPGDGDVYASAQNRIQQLDSNGNFIRAWGFDVVQSGKPEDTGTGFEKCTVAADCKAGISGSAAGQLTNHPLAVDHGDSSVWVPRFNENRIDKFDADGDFLFGLGWDTIPVGGPNDTSEEQAITVDATGGIFTLTFSGQTTAAIPFDATAAVLQEALENLSNLNPGDVSVSGSAGGPWTVKFTGAQKGVNHAQMSADAASLTGGAQTATVTTPIEGATFTGYEICTVATGCKAGSEGSNGGQLARVGGIAIDPRNGDALVADGNNYRMARFNSDGSFDRVMGWDVVPGGLDGLESCTSTVPGACKKGARLEEPSSPPFDTTLGKFYFTQVAQVAIDSTGAFYVAEETLPARRVQKFTPEMTAVSDFAAGELTPFQHFSTAAGDKQARDVEVDLSNDHVFVLRVRVRSEEEAELQGEIKSVEAVEFDASGNLLDINAQVPNLTPQDSSNTLGLLAVNQDRIYLTHRDGAKRQILVADVPQPPLVVATPATEITKTTAKLNAEVDPKGFYTDYHIEYRRQGQPAWKKVPATDELAGTGSGFVSVSQPVGTLAPGATYETRVVATKYYGGGSVTSAPITFQTVPDAPGISTPGAYQTGPDSVRFTAFVDPNNLPTSYHFEYGTGDCSLSACASVPVPDGNAGSESDWTKVTEVVSGLKAGVVYHFRLIASNSVGTTVGQDTLFELGLAPPSSSERAYEQVSPSDKNGADVGDSFWRVNSFYGAASVAPSGDAAAFTAVGTFADSKVGCVVRCDYVSRRGADGWSTRSITPQPVRDNPVAYFSYPSRFNADLTRAVEFSRFAVVGAEHPQGGRFLVDLTTEDLLRLPGSATFPSPGAEEPDSSQDSGFASDDLDQIAYNSEEVLTSDGQPAFGQKTYVHNEGTMELASVLPNGSFPNSSWLGSFLGENGNSTGNATSINTVSEDGRYVFFSSPGGFEGFGGFFGPPAEIYRRDLVSDTTMLVSPSKRAAPDPEGEWFRGYDYASTDGDAVLFRSFSKLTNDSTAALDFSVLAGQPGGWGDLYRYDVDSDALVDVSVDADNDDPLGAQVLGVIAANDEATVVYYAARGEVVPGGTPGKPNLYLWRDDGSPNGDTRFIATLDPADTGVWTSTPRGTAGHRKADMSDSGRLVFQSAAPLTQNEDEELTQVFLYDPAADGGDGQLHCLSCRPDGEPAAAGAFMARAEVPRAEVPGSAATSEEPALVAGETVRTISADGRRVVFESGDPLLPEDINGKRDVYEWHEGEVSLVSTGTDNVDNHFMGMSRDGRDVFFRTRQKLVPSDGDTLFDVYDARQGGGFPISKLPPCVGEECRPEPQDRPTVDLAGSGYFAGGGNVREAPKARKCPKGKRQVKRRGKSRCVKKHSARQHKTNRANANRGGAK